MREYLIKLIPRSSFEVQMHSDTIFGALCWGIRTLYGRDALLNILSQFNKSPQLPPFVISSAFPCRLNKDEYYLPKPILKPLTPDQLRNFAERYPTSDRPYHSPKRALMEIIVKYKEFKKMKWVDSDIIIRHINEMTEANLFTDFLDGIATEPRFAVNTATQKNNLDRLTNSTGGSGNTFYNEERTYKNTWGLYFLMKTDIFSEYIQPTLKFLEDSGIGRNSKTGKNWFTIQWKEGSFLSKNKGTHFVTLSRYIKSEPLFLKNSFYALTSLRSKVESREEFAGEDVWKHKVTYFQEGSVLCPETNNEWYGSLRPVKNIKNKTIYQYGYAYPLWMNMEVDDAI